MTCVDKILGADVELGNVFEHRGPTAISNDRAARLVLAQIDGVAGNKAAATSAFGLAGPAVHGYPGEDPVPAAGYGADPQDWGRRFLDGSGGCFYIDLGHLEACIPEVRSARDFVAAHHANLRLARAACAKANERPERDGRIVLMANNSDRLGQSWGGHLNVLVSRGLWTRLFDRMYPSLFVLAAFQVSSIVYTGQGKVGAENGKDRVDFQITQRGDFFECLAGVQTTCRRPIVNTRDEAHVGAGASASELARLHVIFHDTTLTHGSNYLKAGVTQIVLSMLESGWCDTRVLLDDPLAALTAWGHDPELRAVARLADGRAVTAVEHQQMIAAAARRFVETGQAGFVPDAERILALWEDTLARLACRDFEPLAGRLDWILKRALLQRLLDRDGRLDWHASAIRAADLRFASLDPEEGLYWLVEAAGGTEQIVTDEEIRHAMCEPPADTRAWARTYLLRQFARDDIAAVNWDEIRLAAGTTAVAPTVIRLDDPRRFTRAEILGTSEPAPGGSEATLPAQSPDQREKE
jgi:proteasome accessory factor A